MFSLPEINSSNSSQMAIIMQFEEMASWWLYMNVHPYYALITRINHHPQLNLFENLQRQLIICIDLPHAMHLSAFKYIVCSNWKSTHYMEVHKHETKHTSSVCEGVAGHTLQKHIGGRWTKRIVYLYMVRVGFLE